jgi:hypothetical protein
VVLSTPEQDADANRDCRQPSGLLTSVMRVRGKRGGQAEGEREASPSAWPSPLLNEPPSVRNSTRTLDFGILPALLRHYVISERN